MNARGVALLAVLLSLLLMTALALGLATASSVEMSVAAAYRDGQATLYAADAALGFVLQDLSRETDVDAVLDGRSRAALVDGPPGGTRNASGRTIDLTDILNAARGEDAPWGSNNPVWQLYAYSPASAIVSATGATWPAYVVVLVADDPSEPDQNPLIDVNARLIVRAIAFGTSNSRRTIQATVERVGARLRVLTWRELGVY